MTATAEPIRHATDQVTFLHVNQLRESTSNPRRMFDKKALDELTANVRDHGILQPLLVRQVDEVEGVGLFEVVAGARRLRAARAAGLLEVPAFVREVPDKQVLEMQVMENLHRADVHPIDEGIGFRRLIDECGYRAEDLAKRIGKSMAYVYGRMQIAQLSPAAMELFIDGKFDLSIAQLLTHIGDPKLRERAAKEIAAGRSKWDLDAQCDVREPMSYRDAKEHIRHHYQLDLAEAPFDTGDESLTSAGSCAKCPHRTGNQQTLFEGVEVRGKGKTKGRSNPDLCTNSPCWELKAKAAFAKRRTEVEKVGGKVLEGKEADRVRHSGVDLGATNYRDPKGRTWGQLLGKEAASAPVTLLRTSDGQVLERIDEGALKKAMKAAGKDALAPGARPAEGRTANQEDYRRQKAHRARMQAWNALQEKLEERAAALDAAHALQLIIAHGLDSQAGRRLTDKTALLDMKVPQLQALALRIIANCNPSSTWSTSGWGDSTRAIARACKLDLAAAVREVEKARRAAKPKAKAKAAKGKPKSKAAAAPAKKAKAKGTANKFWNKKRRGKQPTEAEERVRVHEPEGSEE